MKLLYLDYAAATPSAPEIKRYVQRFSRTLMGNPSSAHAFGRKTRQMIDEAREKVAVLLHCEAREIFFTHSATEANNLAIRGIATAARRNHNRDHIILSSIEHSSVLKTCQQLETEGFRVTYLPVDQYGVVQKKALFAALSSHTGLVSIIIANNEIGTIQPIASYANLVHEHAPQAVFHTDAAQWPGFGALDLGGLHVDAMTLSGAKIYGPSNCGALFLREGVLCDPLLFGGNQEHGLWSGTEHVVSIVAFAYALELADQRRKQLRFFFSLRKSFLETLQSRVSDFFVNGHPQHSLPHIIHMTFPNIDQDAFLVALDQVGIAVSGGAACDSGAHTPSHVIQALHLPRRKQQAHIRLSFGINTSIRELQDAAKRIGKVVIKFQVL